MLTPRRLSKFLNSQDEWSLHSRRSFDETWIFSPIPGEREAVVHLPTDPGDVDYARRLIEAIEEIAMLNNSSVERLVGDVLSDGMDRVALRAMPTETQDPLGTTHSLAAIQNLMTFFAQISENSEIGRRIGQATRTTPSEAAKAGCVVLDLVPVPVFAVPAYLPQDTVASSMEANGQAEQGETAWIRRELTLTALRALQTVRSDTNHGTDIDLWAPVENEDDRRQRLAVVVLLESTRSWSVSSFTIEIVWHREGPADRASTSEVQFGPNELSYLNLARQRYGQHV
ncbi:hypothetical protein [Promicromonospora sukumoe]|uniref:Uncharacterized protein n=1 Tax=Promicromonospora sukumoe TaxID=88382 RepID=A0A7W3JAF5_9MICO|nr:hypothetical protein [Promicromonospora sukumoe]MBA8809241.1 hypothetical protein [Promicromonospora sukumoe]